MEPSKEELKLLKQIANFKFSNDRLSRLNGVAKARLKEEIEISNLDERKEEYREELNNEDFMNNIPLDCQDRNSYIEGEIVKHKQSVNMKMLFWFLIFPVMIVLATY